MGRVNGVGRVRVMDRFRCRRGGKRKDESRKRMGRCATIPNVLWEGLDEEGQESSNDVRLPMGKPSQRSAAGCPWKD